MSHEAQTWAIKIEVRSEEELRKGGSSGLARKAVLMYLANRANTEDGASWPSQTRVAADLCCSERCVRNAMRELEDMDIIRREARRGTSDMIYINFDYKPPAGDAGTKQGRSGRGPAGNAPAADSAARESGDDRQEMPETPAADAGEDRHDMPPNQDEPSENHQDESARLAARWPEDYREQFKATYPKRYNIDWKATFRKLGKIEQAGDVEFDDIMAGARTYAARMNRKVAQDPKEEEFIAHATTWLNQERWKNERPNHGSREAASERIKAQRLFV